jgi:hypothetical protein
VPAIPPPQSFTTRYNRRVNKLLNDIRVSSPFDRNAPPVIISQLAEKAKTYKCIWDTGATNSVISQKVVDECGLMPIGMALVNSATEQKRCETFLVSIFLPNKVAVPSIVATKGMLADCDVLIGMDIIALGDFAITHPEGKTMFSFRLPSIGQLDFVKPEPPAHSEKISRNAPCPCGSGKKYKKCCGKSS